MLEIASRSDCEIYHASDLSSEAVGRLSRLISRTATLAHVAVHTAPADDLSLFDDSSYHQVVINSVSQYFPSKAYLTAVLSSAVGLVCPGGCLFLGDVRCADALHLFATSLEGQPPSK